MSRRQDPADVLGGIIFDIFKMLFLGLLILIASIWDSFKKSPEQRLQELTPNESWGGRIESVNCSGCGAINEAGTGHCYVCGRVLS